MIALTLPAMLLLLIPVIVAEGLICRKSLGWRTEDAIRLNAASNLASTLVGVPIAWGAMLLMELGAGALLFQSKAIQNWDSPLANVIYVFIGAAWIGPEEGTIWMIPAAILVLLVPFFFASYWVEYFVIKAMLGRRKEDQLKFEPTKTRIAVRNANLITYGAMFVGTAVWLVVEMARHKKS